ncbi:MAG: putative ATPase [Candidatus Poriferisodalaceae bacterium]|jgi:predicted ATPase
MLQERLRATGSDEAQLRVRVGVHSGVAVERGGDYFGPPVNLAARVMAEAGGGSVLLSAATAALLGETDNYLGEFRLKGIESPQDLYGAGPADVAARTGRLGGANSGVSGELVGRTAELATLNDLFAAKSRLVTVTGPGGVGKTRLAIRLAEDVGTSFSAGVALADLRLAAQDEAVATAVAAAMGLEPDGTSTVDQLRRYVTDRELLLMLDNCEHVVDAVAELVELLLAQPGALTVLVTSREPLEVAGETVVPVAPLSTVDERSSAVELFVERARSAGKVEPLDATELQDVLELCRRIDGLPLAIELAAARCRMFSPSELLSGLEDRFALLSAGRRRGRGAKASSLRDVIDWSYRLLDEEEAALLRSIGVFASSFSLEAVPAVADIDRTLATELMESLVA